MYRLVGTLTVLTTKRSGNYASATTRRRNTWFEFYLFLWMFSPCFGSTEQGFLAFHSLFQPLDHSASLRMGVTHPVQGLQGGVGDTKVVPGTPFGPETTGFCSSIQILSI